MRLLRYLVATALAFVAIRAYGASLADEITTGVKTPPIGPGASGPLVIRAQILLDRARFSPGEIDGIFGEDLGIAVKGYPGATPSQARGRDRRGNVEAAAGSDMSDRAGTPMLAPRTCHFEISKLGPEGLWWKSEPINPYPLLVEAMQRETHH